MSYSVLRLEAITKSYAKGGNRVSALRGVTLTVSKGEFLALRGPSGCGKTTALLIAGGLLAPDAGKALLHGVDFYVLKPEGRANLRARKVGFVFQQFHLIPYLSVIDNIRAPALALKEKNGTARAEELACRFDLLSRANHLPSELSTGECQRVALARALFNNPDLILADEPTGNLDEKNAASVIEALRVFARAGGAVLLVTHDPRAVAYSDRFCTMQNGVLTDA